MSFGFSVGDFVAVAGLITQVASALREAGGSASQYQHITDKLLFVDQVIRDVDRLEPVEGLEVDLEATKKTALRCRIPLEEYLKTIRPYDKSLGPGQSSSVKDTLRKMKWLVTKKLEAAMKLEAEIVGYVGAINLCLGMYNLKANILTGQRRRRSESLTMNQHIQTQTIIAQDTRLVRKDIEEFSKETSQALKSLQQTCFASVSEFLKTAGTLSKVTLQTWSQVCEIYNNVLWIRSHLSEPDTRHTWFQEPMRWEDAYGRVIPIPAEFDYPMMEGALRGHFREGRGKKLVERNQWQLFDPSSPRTVFSVENWETFPGMKITMAMIISQYDDQMVCPRLTCSSKSYTDALGGGKLCSGCETWFDSLPKYSSPQKITEIVDSKQYSGETQAAKLPSKIAGAAKSGLQARDEDTGSDTESEIDEEDLRHLKNARVRLEGPKRTSMQAAMRCNACGLTLPTVAALCKHNITEHGGVRTYICAFGLSGCTSTSTFPTAAALRKHITSDHGELRTYTCTFRFNGCTSTFASVTEWKRHVNSQHLAPEFWRCEIGPCGDSHDSRAVPHNTDFNRKDLFEQHLRRMHSPSAVENQTWASAEWNAEGLELQAAAAARVRVRRKPPSHTCPVGNCGALFEGNYAWNQRMEHVGRHLEGVAAGEEEGGWCQGEDAMLLEWASGKRIIHRGGRWVLNDGSGKAGKEDADGEDEWEDE